MARVAKQSKNSQRSEASLDNALDSSFPASDPPAQTDPGHGIRSGVESPPEEAIRLRAYEIWLEAGCPDGSHEEHWRQARAELEPGR